jgi:hypothetical protein
MMQRISKIFGLISIAMMSCLIASASSFIPQTNTYSKDGVSFSYPLDWPLSDESDAQAQTLSLDRGQNEAKILVMVLRQEMNTQQLAQAQALMTQAIVDNLTQSFMQAGAQSQRSSVSAVIGGRQASGIRLRATLQGESGNADVYWLAINNRLVHVVLIGADEELARAVNAWNMICSTLRVGSASDATRPGVKPPAS